MSSHSLPPLAVGLLKAQDVDTALQLVSEALAVEKHTGVALLAFDARRNTIIDRRLDRAVTPPQGTKRNTGGEESPQVALDHLPLPVRQTLLAGQHFADVGEQALQYARLLGILPPTDDIRLFLKGIVLDGVLTAVLAAYDGRRRGGTKLLERLEPLASMFELTYARLFERDARFEAVTALHDVTSRIRAEHANSVGELTREITRLRTARGDVIDRKRADDLEAAAENAQRRAIAAEKRLAAVEQQVTSAVARLEEAHLQIYRQAEELRVKSETGRREETPATP
ncbi:MAG TPA: hypothetical protein VNU46_05380 [Gemmatimonadaceae bacterium]|jgi:hypothetical protein|nr:hypothetical protein [Gemmatimonadaceae bacterium]